jgi:hypothetical protein
MRSNMSIVRILPLAAVANWLNSPSGAGLSYDINSIGSRHWKCINLFVYSGVLSQYRQKLVHRICPQVFGSGAWTAVVLATPFILA